jgi:hypothetical protein
MHAPPNSDEFALRYYFSIITILNRHRIYLSKYFKNQCVPAARRGGLSTRGDLDERICQVEARNRPVRSHRRGDSGWCSSQGSPASACEHCRCAVSRAGSLFHLHAAQENMLALLRGTQGRPLAGRVSLIETLQLIGARKISSTSFVLAPCRSLSSAEMSSMSSKDPVRPRSGC